MMDKSLDMSMLSEERGEISFSCDLCNFQGDSNVCLKIHMNRKHRDILQLDGNTLYERDTDC